MLTKTSPRTISSIKKTQFVACRFLYVNVQLFSACYESRRVQQAVRETFTIARKAKLMNVPKASSPSRRCCGLFKECLV